MRVGLLAAVAWLPFTGGSAALAADGVLGSRSSGTVTIQVSVAPRVWHAGEQLCIAGPASGYSLRPADGSDSLRWSQAEGCTGQAQGIRLESPATGRSTLLIVAE